MTRTYVIAEAGVNHNGSLDRALDLVDAAAAAGADAVKFQTFRSELVISINAQKADYQKLTTGISESQLEMVRKLELDENSHFRLMERARQRSIEFLSTPFDEPSVDFLVGGMGLSRIKIPSGEITNGPLLLRVASKKVPVIMSTGMATLKEIETALGVLAFGYCDESQIPPSIDAFSQAFESTRGKAQLEKNVVLLHCTTEYPAPVNECNLRAMHGMRETFGLPVGYSDHTDGIVIALAAVALGAVIIEKHFTLDRALPGPDHLASLEPGQLGQMVREIRMIEQALGDGIKRPQASERKNLPIARKSLMAARPIRQGEQFTRENVIPKRPNTGLSPMLFWEVAALTANRDYDTDEPLDIVVKVLPI